MLEIIYTSEGSVLPDQKVEIWAESVTKRYKARGGTKLHVSAALMVDAIRIQVIRGNIAPEDVQFFNGDDPAPIGINKHGRLEHWPAGFCDVQDNMLNELLQSKNYIKEKVNGNA